MTEEFEEKYDKFIEDLKRILPKVDPNFASRVMYLERKLANEIDDNPHVTINLEYQDGTDMDRKLAVLRDKYSLEAEYTDKHHILFGMGRMKLATVADISRDETLIKISGKASPIIRT